MGNKPQKENRKIESTTMVEEKKEDERLRSSSSATCSLSSSTTAPPSSPPPQVIVKPMGFVSRMAEYMVAADILITKAGPGTIAEAAALGLPTLLTSFLPGQEEGNVDFVVEKKFGRYVSDGNPMEVSEVACEWLEDLQLLRQMSDCAMDAGCPHAAEEIVRCIGESVVRWKELNEAG